MENTDDLFKGRHFDRESSSFASGGISGLAQLSRSRGNDGRTRDFSGSYDGNALDPALCSGIRKAVEPFACRAGGSWRVDETYVKIKATGLISIALSTSKEKLSIFFSAQSGMSRPPKRFSVGRSRARADCRTPSRLTATKPRIGRRGSFSATSARQADQIRSSKYLNNLIEQDHRDQTSIGANAWVEALSKRLNHHRRY